MIKETVLGLVLSLNTLTPLSVLSPIEQLHELSSKTQPITFEITESNYEKEQNRKQKRLNEMEKKEQQKQWKQGRLTAYYNGKDRMNGETGITASGFDLDNGIYYKQYRILAADKSIPLGTLVDIQLSNGTTYHGIVLDRGNRIVGNKFDIVMNSYDECISFGNQEITYTIKNTIEIDH